MKQFTKFFFCVFYLLQLPTILNAQYIAGGGAHSLYVCTDGTAWGCGDNFVGQVGNGGFPSSNTISAVNTPPTVVTAVAAGYTHSLFIENGGVAWACGDNTFSTLGDGVFGGWEFAPVQVSFAGGTVITAVSAGHGHSLFLKNDGTVWACGYNDQGQLGIGSSGTYESTPVQVSFAGGTVITAIAAGWAHSLFLKNDGTVWACGEGVEGQLGNGGLSNSLTPVQVSFAGGTIITAVAAGWYHSLFLKNDGTVWACGYNDNGQIGDGTSGTAFCNPASGPPCSKSTPVQVSFAGGTVITAISAGDGHSLFLKNDGAAWACGQNNYGQLGDGSGSNKSTPVQVSFSAGTVITAIAAGNAHSLFVKNNGTTWACGSNVNGQLGDGTNINRSTPVYLMDLCTVSLPMELTSFTAQCVVDNIVTMKWTTSSEINNDYFAVERSSNYKEWEKIGTVQGAGNSSVINNYQFTDSHISHLTSHILYYRLKQTDFSGDYTYSNIVSVDMKNQASTFFTIYSNPVKNDLQLSINGLEISHLSLEIVDMLGKVIIDRSETSTKGISKLDINVSELKSGVYFLKLTEKETPKSSVSKFVKL